jgi:hypothetical protein
MAEKFANLVVGQYLCLVQFMGNNLDKFAAEDLQSSLNVLTPAIGSVGLVRAKPLFQPFVDISVPPRGVVSIGAEQ